MANPYILMWLEGPHQSWGCDSRYGRRETLDFPTKSGVLGIVCAALGAGGEQRELLKSLSSLDMQVLAFSRLVDNKPSASPITMQDFQMVGSGYDEKDPWMSLFIPKTSAGKKAVGGGTKLTYREYIQDMAFAVLLEVPEEKSEEIADALISPVWELSLGRKNCSPTEFIYQGTFSECESANKAATSLATEKDRGLLFRVKQGAIRNSYSDNETLILNDVPITFGDNKRYRDRQVTIIRDEND